MINPLSTKKKFDTGRPRPQILPQHSSSSPLTDYNGGMKQDNSESGKPAKALQQLQLFGMFSRSPNGGGGTMREHRLHSTS